MSVNGFRGDVAPLIVGLALLLPLVPSSSAAEPITVRGIVEVRSEGGDLPDIPAPLLELLGYFSRLDPRPDGLDSLSVEAHATSPVHGTIGGLDIMRSAPPSPIAAGQGYDVSSRSTWTRGTLTETSLVGCCFESVFYPAAGDFRFDGGSAVLQPYAPGSTMLIGSAPMTFAGTVQAFDRTSGAPLFTRQLIGLGTATVYLRPDDPSWFLHVYEVEPIPEPASLVLLTAGGAALLIARKRFS